MNDKFNLLIKAREAYYNSGHPIMSDQEYDAIEESIKQEFPDHPFFETIGHPPSLKWKTGRHQIFMGSLEKVHNSESILKWANKFIDQNDILSRIFALQFKLDGLSISLSYKNSKFVNALTRGDGIEGEDISDNVRLMKNFKEILPDFTGSIRSEIIMYRKDFENINNTLSKEEKYANPRNAASGISRRLDGKYCKYLQLISYDLSEELDEHKKLKKLYNMGLVTVENIISYIDKITEAFENLKKNRANLPYNIDGAVIKIVSFNAQKKHGIIRNKPKTQIAWKFDPPDAITTFIEEVWDVGRTGVVTPIAILKPIEIEGSTIRKATLHNIAEIKRLGIGRGDTVMLIKAGEIIPKITTIIEHKGTPIEIIKKCPSCKTELINDSIRLTCLNDDCPKKNFYRVLNWIKITGIEEYGESLGKELERTDTVKKIQDLYNLKENDISCIEGWGSKIAKKIINNINKTRTLPPEIFLSAIGIPRISERTSKELLNAFGSIKNLMEKGIEDIKQLKGFSDISANNIVVGLSKYQLEIQELLKIINLSSEKQKKEKLSKLSFCFTGAMKQSRSYYQKLVEKYGGINKSSVTKDLSYLICNENKNSTKSRNAEKFNIKIINEKEFLEMIDEIQTQAIQSEKFKIENYSLFE